LKAFSVHVALLPLPWRRTADSTHFIIEPMQPVSMACVCVLQEGAAGSKELPECVLEVPSLHEVELNHGKQDLPDFSRPGSAAGEPIMKERALLQVFVQPCLNTFEASQMPVHLHRPVSLSLRDIQI